VRRHVHGLSTAVWLLLPCLAILAQGGCKSQDMMPSWGLKTEHPTTALEKFSHDLHEGVFQRENIECFACHTTAARTDDEKEAADAIGTATGPFTPGKEQCHVCHYNPVAGNTAPDRCSLCHLDVQEIAPANHNFDWMNRHAVFAKADPARCEECHRPSFCQECHNRRDETVRRVHDRNFRFVHGIEARANPMRCGQCHAQSFCEGCHVKGGYER
jgi:hypothetical protein